MSNRENLSLARNDINPPSNLLPFHLNGEEVYASSFFWEEKPTEEMGV